MCYTQPCHAVHGGEGGLGCQCIVRGSLSPAAGIVPMTAIMGLCSGHSAPLGLLSQEGPSAAAPVQRLQCSSALLQCCLPGASLLSCTHTGLVHRLQGRDRPVQAAEERHPWLGCARGICSSCACAATNTGTARGLFGTGHCRPPEGREETLNPPFGGDLKVPSRCFCCVLPSRERLFLQQFVIRVWYLTF